LRRLGITCPRCTLDSISVYHSGAAGIDITRSIIPQFSNARF